MIELGDVEQDDNEHIEAQTQSALAHISDVEQTASLQAMLINREAKNTLAALKQKEQHKLNVALAELKANSNAFQQATAEQSQSNSTDVEQGKGIGNLDQLLMDGQLLHPLVGLEKIQGVHQVQLDTLLGQINATLESGESLTGEDKNS